MHDQQDPEPGPREEDDRTRQRCERILAAMIPSGIEPDPRAVAIRTILGRLGRPATDAEIDSVLAAGDGEPPLDGWRYHKDIERFGAGDPLDALTDAALPVVRQGQPGGRTTTPI